MEEKQDGLLDRRKTMNNPENSNRREDNRQQQQQQHHQENDLVVPFTNSTTRTQETPQRLPTNPRVTRSGTSLNLESPTSAAALALSALAQQQPRRVIHTATPSAIGTPQADTTTSTATTSTSSTTSAATTTHAPSSTQPTSDQRFQEFITATRSIATLSSPSVSDSTPKRGPRSLSIPMMGSKKSSGKNNADRAGKPLLLLAPNSTTALNESMPIAKRLSGTKRKSDSVPAVTPTPKKTQSIITQPAPAPTPAATYNRKAKSLSLLCQNFCSQDWSQGICINDAALMFGVERRRIYDIVNILDSLGVVKRICKNKYEWLGFENVPRVLGEFQSEDLDPAPNEKKTLGMLCKQFLQLFLKGNETLCLYEASNIIMGPPDSAKSMKTKVRRLYDIANIFMSLRLITKLDEDVRKAKPVFKWAYEMDSDQIRAGFNGQSISPELKGESVVSKAIGVNRVVGVSVSNEQKDESMQIVITPLKRVSEKRGVPVSSTSVLSSPEQIQIKAGPEIDGNSSSIEAPIRAVTLETEPCSPAQEKHLFERIHETGADFAAATPAK